MILHSRQWIDHYLDEGRWGQGTLLEQFDQNRAANPDREAVVDPPDRPDLVGTAARSLNYRTFGRAVDATAAELARRGLGKDHIVVAQLPNVWELAMLYLAVARAGGVLTALPLQWRATDVGYVRELTEARLYIAADHAKGFDYIAMGRTLGFEQCLSLAELTAIAEGPVGSPPPPVTVDANDIFTLCWTSGTESRLRACS
ncbi:AMP-binding protein [Alcanivorax sp. 24]|uniref:AMP-binding protein n=1 Tax=Alcanivorax sp. 24 TaxID=2545266 RepID=UPI00105B49EE|nr:AMP-binding protein [Alcanivorax sp. 24]